jgi:DNA polymerase elongation subunit (family B)
MGETFDLSDLDLDGVGTATVEAEAPRTDARTPDNDVELWAEKQCAKPAVPAPCAATGSVIVFDIETGPLSEAELKALFKEKTFEEFSASCDGRWKEDTKRQKYEEYKVSAWQEFVEKAALSATTGKVLAIGWKTAAGDEFIADPSETVMLTEFWDRYRYCCQRQDRLVGHNIHGFDLPFLVRRSWILGIDVPADVIRDGRYWSKVFIDTMAVWAFGQKGVYIGLDALARLFGVGQKPEGVSGGDFAKLWFGSAEDRARALEYLRNDLALTAAVARKLGIG